MKEVEEEKEKNEDGCTPLVNKGNNNSLYFYFICFDVVSSDYFLLVIYTYLLYLYLLNINKKTKENYYSTRLYKATRSKLS